MCTLYRLRCTFHRSIIHAFYYSLLVTSIIMFAGVIIWRSLMPLVLRQAYLQAHLYIAKLPLKYDSFITGE